MDAKDLRTEAALGERSNDGNTKYAQGSSALPCNRNKTYQDIGSNSLGKVDGAMARPCAVIGPDRVVPPPASTDAYLKKAPAEPWLSLDNSYRRPPEYPHKLLEYQHPTRNISPRQTFQENMQRIMLPHTYSSAKLKEDHHFPGDPNLSQMRSNKISVPIDPNPKYCDVPYTVNPITNEQKNVRSSDISAPNMNTVLTRSAPHGWPHINAGVRPSKPYPQDIYQYSEYPSCSGPRPMLMTRPHRTVHEEPGPMYSDAYYQDGSVRFKPYPTVKERYPQSRYEYVGNYSNPFHPPPPFPSHKYDLQKQMPPHPYPGYPQVPIKYIDSRIPESVMNGYQRPLNPQTNYNNMQFRTQVLHPTYGPVPGNCLPTNKFYPYPPDSSKPIPSSKLPYDINNKVYAEYESNRTKNYPMSEAFYVNEITRSHPMKSQVLPPSYPTNIHPTNIHSMPPTHPYYRKESVPIKGYEYGPHFRNVDPTVNGNQMSRFPTHFSPSSIAISPADSNTSNETGQTHGLSQEDCGYVSQSSTASGRSIDSNYARMPHELYRRFDHRYAPMKTSPLSKLEPNASNNIGSKGKKDIDVRQFLQMWNEGEDENGDNNNKEMIVKTIPNNSNNDASNQEQLYVLGLVNVPSEELGKYEHIQKVSKLPENIKGYNSIELLHQFEEVIESSNLNHYNMKQSAPRDHFRLPTKNAAPLHSTAIPSRPLSPLDVEAKISQSVIHKEVGCNFEIKPCSPKMLNVEVAAPVQTILGERVIEKVSNPIIIQSPALHNVEESRDNCNIIKRQERIAGNESTKVASCKMVNTQYSRSDRIDSVKTDYSLQDLESNSGVCLASLPRLDNDIELNFPEVNQQFINANKVDSVITTAPIKDLPALDIDQYDTKKDSDAHIVEDNKCPSSRDEKDCSKLSKYRKLKKRESRPNTPESTVQALRTDSVIIKNPDNVKSHEIVEKSPKNNAENSKNDPINLTVNTDTDTRANDVVPDFSANYLIGDKPNDFAIDFSITSSDHSEYKSSGNSQKACIKQQQLSQCNYEKLEKASESPLSNNERSDFNAEESISNVLEDSNKLADLNNSGTNIDCPAKGKSASNYETTDEQYNICDSESMTQENLFENINSEKSYHDQFESQPDSNESATFKRENCHIIDKMKELFGEYSPGEAELRSKKNEHEVFIDVDSGARPDFESTSVVHSGLNNKDICHNEIVNKGAEKEQSAHIEPYDTNVGPIDAKCEENNCESEHESTRNHEKMGEGGDQNCSHLLSFEPVVSVTAGINVAVKETVSSLTCNEFDFKFHHEDSSVENNNTDSSSETSDDTLDTEGFSDIEECELIETSSDLKDLRNFQSYLNKSLISPWIQKLITCTEGPCTIVSNRQVRCVDSESKNFGKLREESNDYTADITDGTDFQNADTDSCTVTPMNTETSQYTADITNYTNLQNVDTDSCILTPMNTETSQYAADITNNVNLQNAGTDSCTVTARNTETNKYTEDITDANDLQNVDTDLCIGTSMDPETNKCTADITDDTDLQNVDTDSCIVTSMDTETNKYTADIIDTTDLQTDSSIITPIDKESNKCTTDITDATDLQNVDTDSCIVTPMNTETSQYAADITNNVDLQNAGTDSCTVTAMDTKTNKYTEDITDVNDLLNVNTDSCIGTSMYTETNKCTADITDNTDLQNVDTDSCIVTPMDTETNKYTADITDATDLQNVDTDLSIITPMAKETNKCTADITDVTDLQNVDTDSCIVTSMDTETNKCTADITDVTDLQNVDTDSCIVIPMDTESNKCTADITDATDLQNVDTDSCIVTPMDTESNKCTADITDATGLQNVDTDSCIVTPITDDTNLQNANTDSCIVTPTNKGELELLSHGGETNESTHSEEESNVTSDNEDNKEINAVIVNTVESDGNSGTNYYKLTSPTNMIDFEEINELSDSKEVMNNTEVENTNDVSKATFDTNEVSDSLSQKSFIDVKSPQAHINVVDDVSDKISLEEKLCKISYLNSSLIENNLMNINSETKIIDTLIKCPENLLENTTILDDDLTRDHLDNEPIDNDKVCFEGPSDKSREIAAVNTILAPEENTSENIKSESRSSLEYADRVCLESKVFNVISSQKPFDSPGNMIEDITFTSAFNSDESSLKNNKNYTTENKIYSPAASDKRTKERNGNHLEEEEAKMIQSSYFVEAHNVVNHLDKQESCSAYNRNNKDSFANTQSMEIGDSQNINNETNILNEVSQIEDDVIVSTNDNIILEQEQTESFISNIRYPNTYKPKKRKHLKRSLSESALDDICENSNEDSANVFWPNKRKKNIEVVNDEETRYLAENYCNILQNNRRNSISSMYNEGNVSFCILIDNNCIITEECEEEQKICFDGVHEECLDCVSDNIINDEEEETTEEIIGLQEGDGCDYSTSYETTYSQEDKSQDQPWVEDVACMETVVSDDIGENIVISASTSPKDSDGSDGEYIAENEMYNVNEHTDKLKYIYGDKMCRDEAHFVETLYRTPQMNVNRTLVYRESQVMEECTRYYDKESLERILSGPEIPEETTFTPNVELTNSVLSSPPAYNQSPNHEIPQFDNAYRIEDSYGMNENIDLAKDCGNIQYTEKPDCLPDINKPEDDDIINSCELSISEAISSKSREESLISSSPEVSSTTPEEKNSGILLKITNYGGARISQVNDIIPVQRISCKYTEKKDYLSSNNNLPTRTLITKAAQKYIPPLKETIPNLKVKLQLPEQSLIKLKQLKVAKETPKPNVIKTSNILSKNEISKKPKPKFEDVLKSIDEIQFQKHKEKSKKVKKAIPKVVIKKSGNGSHYASTSQRDRFNPDLTGRKWQPWVFLEKNRFIDKMVVKNKSRAIFSHRKNTFVLAEKFQKYKSIGSTKFFISQPKRNDSSSGQLKYTIRLKHNY